MAMAGRFVALFVALCCVSSLAQAKTYDVGNEIGWVFTNDSSGSPADFQAWADQITFMKDDILVFKYTPGQQNLYIFDTHEAWMACNFSRGYMLDNGSAGISEWAFPSEGHYDFASAKFCYQKQKFSVYAVDPDLLITQVTAKDDGGAPAPNPVLSPGPEPPNDTPPSPIKDLNTPPSRPPPPPPSASPPVAVGRTVVTVLAFATLLVMLL